MQDAHMTVYPLHMTVYPLHPQNLAGGSNGAVAYLRNARRCTDDSFQPPASAPVDRQKRQSCTGAGAEDNGKQHPSDHRIYGSGRQDMHADTMPTTSRKGSGISHPGRHDSTSRGREEEASPVKTQRVHASGTRQSKSDGESESHCESGNGSQSECESESSSEGNGRIHMLPEGTHAAAGHAQQAAFECLDAIFSSTGPGKASLKRKVGQASLPIIQYAAKFRRVCIW